MAGAAEVGHEELGMIGDRHARRRPRGGRVPGQFHDLDTSAQSDRDREAFPVGGARPDPVHQDYQRCVGVRRPGAVDDQDPIIDPIFDPLPPTHPCIVRSAPWENPGWLGGAAGLGGSGAAAGWALDIWSA